MLSFAGGCQLGLTFASALIIRAVTLVGVSVSVSQVVRLFVCACHRLLPVLNVRPDLLVKQRSGVYLPEFRLFYTDQ